MTEHSEARRVLYVERWNEETRRPIVGTSWLTDEEAARRYADRQSFTAVDGARGADGELRPRWAIGFGRRGARVEFFTPGGGSIEQSTDYDDRDGRLWRWITRRYLYTDDSRFHEQSECAAMYTAEFEPDGTGYIHFDETSKGTVDRARMTDAPVSGFWLDWPEFGHWDDLAHRAYGVPPEPATPSGPRYA